jgi:purine-binding chemotaxis protein CheW
MMTINYYLILEINPQADQEVIEAAYRRLALLYHPDLNSSPEATQRMQEVNVAYNTLRNPTRRAKYDQDHYNTISGYRGQPISTTVPYKGAAQPHITYKPPQPPDPIPVKPSAPSNETQLLTFLIDNSIYAFNILDVESVNMMQPILRNVEAPSFVEGLIAYRAQQIPVIDLRRHIGFSDQPTTRNTRILVVRFSDVQTGLIVDGAGMPIWISNTAIEAPRALTPEEQSPFVKGIVRQGFQMIVVLDLQSLLTQDEYINLKTFMMDF